VDQIIQDLSDRNGQDVKLTLSINQSINQSIN